MKYKLRIFLTLCGSLFFAISFGQISDSVNLFDCYRLVRLNAPQLELLKITQSEVALEQDKLSATNLPGVSAYGSASYQSDAIAMELSLPGVTPFAIDLFQYNAGVSVNQKVFDGGMVRIQKNIKVLEGEVKGLETEAALYKLNELTNEYFFGIASMYKTIEILDLKIEVLEERKKSVESAVEQGVLQQSEVSRMQAEIISSKQQKLEVEVGVETMKQGLSILTGLDITSINIKLPEVIRTPDTVDRIELKLFDANRNYLQSISDMQNKRYIPKFNAFGQTGYSYPGLNVFENQSDFYYIVGVKMGWNIFDWNQSKKEKQLIQLQQSRIDVAQLDFERNINVQAIAQANEIDRLQEVIKNDKDIIYHKEIVRKASASSLKNGSITSADYLRDLNEELHARHNMEKHKIELLEAHAILSVIKGINLN